LAEDIHRDDTTHGETCESEFGWGVCKDLFSNFRYCFAMQWRDVHSALC